MHSVGYTNYTAKVSRRFRVCNFFRRPRMSDVPRSVVITKAKATGSPSQGLHVCILPLSELRNDICLHVSAVTYHFTCR